MKLTQLVASGRVDERRKKTKLLESNLTELRSLLQGRFHLSSKDVGYSFV